MTSNFLNISEKLCILTKYSNDIKLWTQADIFSQGEEHSKYILLTLFTTFCTLCLTLFPSAVLNL